MKIENFKKHFVDYIDECNEVGVPARITLSSIDIFPHKWLTVIGCKTVDNKMILLTKDDCRPNIGYKFTNKNIFDNIEEVTFLVDGEEISDFELGDVSWSEREFSFVADF